MNQPLSKVRNLKESDSALMLSFAAGDQEGFELLYRRYSASVYRFFFYGTQGNEPLSAELFQDVWMTVVRGRVRYSTDINFVDWLFHSAWARLHDHLRLHPIDDDGNDAGQRSSVVRMDTFAKKGSDNAALADANDGNDELSEAEVKMKMDVGAQVTAEESGNRHSLLRSIKNLSSEHTEIVLLRYCFSMDSSDIAEFLDIRKDSVDRLVRDAVKCLRHDMAEVLNDG